MSILSKGRQTAAEVVVNSSPHDSNHRGRGLFSRLISRFRRQGLGTTVDGTAAEVALSQEPRLASAELPDAAPSSKGTYGTWVGLEERAKEAQAELEAISPTRKMASSFMVEAKRASDQGDAFQEEAQRLRGGARRVLDRLVGVSPRDFGASAETLREIDKAKAT